MDVVAAIRDNIITWSKSALDVGIDLIYQKMFRPVYDVQGIGFAAIKVAVTTNLTPPAAEEYQSRNVEISEVEIAALDKSRITVQELLA
jgi:peptide deformylase